MFLRYGVTTIVDLANPTEWTLAQREALKQGRIKGPRMLVTGNRLAGASAPYSIHLRTPRQAKIEVGKLVQQGVNAIKIHDGLSTELIKAVVDAARQSGLPVVGHSANARTATRVGLKFVEHMRPIVRATLADPTHQQAMDDGRLQYAEHLMDESLFDSLIELLVNERVYVNPTFWYHYGSEYVGPRLEEWSHLDPELAADPSLGFVPMALRGYWAQGQIHPLVPISPEKREEFREGFRKTRLFVQRLTQAGGKVLSGSSQTNGPPGLSLLFEVEALVDAGVTPMQAILSATKWPAEFFGQDNEIGTIEVGKKADMVVIAGDPLTDIAAIRNILWVIKDGNVLDTTLDPNFKNPLPRNAPNAIVGE